MRATLVGHACWLFETAGGRVLTDPVLADPFEEGTVTACPSRQVAMDALPPLDALYISHRHLDHFDIDTLKRLDHELPVYCPEDAVLIAALRHIGFTDCRILEAFNVQTLGGLRICPLPAVTDDFVECGAVFQDDSGTVLNQVDTPLKQEVISRLRTEFGQLDVHIAMFASQDFNVFHNKPNSISRAHTRNLDAAITLGAKVVVPGSAGFRFVDELGWLNQYVFPIERQRFADDLRRLQPETTVETINPGDVMEIEGGEVTVHRQASPFVHMTADDTDRLRYDPTSPVPELADRNAPEYPLDALHSYIEQLMESSFVQYLDTMLNADGPVTEYLECNAVYRVEVVFPDHIRSWSFAFDAAQRSYDTVVDQAKPQPTKLWRVTASGLVDLCEGRRGCFGLRTESRRWESSMVPRLEAGRVGAEELELVDLLRHFIINMRIQTEGREKALLAYYGLITGSRGR
jgi:L-ascorbate metabolism protein UlaG (beta-lactamase superfamily)